jgi:hypothetical protein
MVQLSLLILLLESYMCSITVKRVALFNPAASIFRAEKRGKIMSINLQAHHPCALKYVADFNKLFINYNAESV